MRTIERVALTAAAGLGVIGLGFGVKAAVETDVTPSTDTLATANEAPASNVDFLVGVAGLTGGAALTGAVLLSVENRIHEARMGAQEQPATVVD